MKQQKNSTTEKNLIIEDIEDFDYEKFKRIFEEKLTFLKPILNKKKRYMKEKDILD